MSDKVTTENREKGFDYFWGQPHVENERFAVNEFEPEIVKLFMEEPFLAQISMNISKHADPKCRTAYVGVFDNSYELVMGINPYFFRSISSVQRQNVIKHELYHVVLMHLLTRLPTDRKLQKLWNVATDLAINSIIVVENNKVVLNKLPDFALIPGVLPKNSKSQAVSEFIAQAPKLQNAEYYFAELKKLANDNPEESFDDLDFDEHSSWGEIPTDVYDQIRDKITNIVKKAVDEADSKNQWGSVPASMQSIIRKSLKGEVNWEAIMSQFFGSARTVERISTIKKISRKMPGVLPGVKRKVKAKFAFFIDQSGSMSDSDVSKAFAEVEKASKETEIDVYNFDTEIDVNSHRVWKRGVKYNWQRTRCGGTDFNSIARFVNKPENRGKWSGIVILTDGWADKLGTVVGAKVMWVLTPDSVTDATRPTDIVIKLKK